MPRSDAPICRYFAQSCCKLGDACSFRHALPSKGDTVCRFYLAGSCAYGAKCRLDHVKPKAVPRTPPPPPPPSRPAPPAPPPQPLPAASAAVGTQRNWAAVAASAAEAEEELGELRLSPPEPAGEPAEALPEASRGRAADPWAELSASARGEGEGEGEEGEASAGASRRNLRASRLAASAAVECSVCLELVLSKPVASERRFGLLPACSHAFCLACIRAWRASPQSAPGGAGQAAAEHSRTCPVCRTISFYVAPSTTWPRDEAEKAEALQAYRARLAAIPCRHFDRGAGSCPFGSSCFFGHTLPDGSAPPPATLRRYGDADGEVRIVEPVRLAAFLGTDG